MLDYSDTAHSEPFRSTGHALVCSPTSISEMPRVRRVWSFRDPLSSRRLASIQAFNPKMACKLDFQRWPRKLQTRVRNFDQAVRFFTPRQRYVLQHHSQKRQRYDAFGLIGTTFRALGWKTLIFFERAVSISPNAWGLPCYWPAWLAPGPSSAPIVPPPPVPPSSPPARLDTHPALWQPGNHCACLARRHGVQGVDRERRPGRRGAAVGHRQVEGRVRRARHRLAVQLGLYPIVTSQYSSTTLYQVPDHI